MSIIPAVIIVKLNYTSCKKTFKNYTIGNLMLLDGKYIFGPKCDMISVTNNIVEFYKYDFDKKNFYTINTIEKGIIVNGNPFINEDGTSKYSNKEIKSYMNQGYSNEWKIMKK